MPLQGQAIFPIFIMSGLPHWDHSDQTKWQIGRNQSPWTLKYPGFLLSTVPMVTNSPNLGMQCILALPRCIPYWSTKGFWDTDGSSWCANNASSCAQFGSLPNSSMGCMVLSVFVGSENVSKLVPIWCDHHIPLQHYQYEVQILGCHILEPFDSEHHQHLLSFAWVQSLPSLHHYRTVVHIDSHILILWQTPRYPNTIWCKGEGSKVVPALCKNSDWTRLLDRI